MTASDTIFGGRRRRPGRWLARLGEPLLGYAMIAPVVVVIVALSGYQLVRLVAISFTNERVGMAPGSLRFVGLENYVLLARWPEFARMVANTLVLTVSVVGLELVVGMLAALALNAGVRGHSLISAIVFLPWVIPGIVAAFLWRLILDSENGVVNVLLVDDLHLFAEHIRFLDSTVLALPSVVFVMVWRGAPFAIILFLGALQTVPGDLHEAAKADGANAWHRWRHVTLPHVRRVVAIVAILSTIWTLQDYTTPYSLTLGGPANATIVVAILTYFFGTRQFQTAEAATVPTLFLPVIAALVFVLFRVLGTREEES